MPSREGTEAAAGGVSGQVKRARWRGAVSQVSPEWVAVKEKITLWALRCVALFTVGGRWARDSAVELLGLGEPSGRVEALFTGERRDRSDASFVPPGLVARPQTDRLEAVAHTHRGAHGLQCLTVMSGREVGGRLYEAHLSLLGRAGRHGEQAQSDPHSAVAARGTAMWRRIVTHQERSSGETAQQEVLGSVAQESARGARSAAPSTIPIVKSPPRALTPTSPLLTPPSARSGP